MAVLKEIPVVPNPSSYRKNGNEYESREGEKSQTIRNEHNSKAKVSHCSTKTEMNDVPRVQTEGLMDRYHRATASKLYDVEELVDFYFHRRLAAVVAVVVSYLPIIITPNQITIFGLIIGWFSAAFLYDAQFHTLFGLDERISWFLAATLMFVWIVSDCADGQVARLCKRGTRTGRILDGVVDGFVIAPNLYVVGKILVAEFGAGYFKLAVAGGLSLWIHAIAYDKIKNVYMEHALPESECDGETVESVHAEYIDASLVDPYSLDCVLLGIYYQYLHVQSLFSNPREKESSVKLSIKASESRRAAYVRDYYHIARLASFFGISAHVTGLYIAYGAAYFWREALIALELYFLVVLNLLCIVVLVMYSRSGMFCPELAKARIS